MALRSAFRHLVRHLNSPPTPPRTTISSLRALYAAGTPITMVTAYDYPTALHVNRAGVDIALVGDSVAMVTLGHRTTQAVTIDEMLHHVRAARRATDTALLVADLPFGSYETCPRRAVDTAVRFIKEGGADAVKLEGGLSRAPAVERIVDAGVAVMGHVGLLPQAVSRVGAFKAVGRSAPDAARIVNDAIALEQAGVFAIVIECVPARVARLVTSSVDVPTIGIGSGVECDGQVLVYHDMLGILNHPHHQNVAPKFSKAFANAGSLIDQGLRDYCAQVRSRQFPDAAFSPYTIPDDEFEQLERIVEDMNTSNSNIVKKTNEQKQVIDADETIKIY